SLTFRVFFLLILLRPPSSRSPYTTLFRSRPELPPAGGDAPPEANQPQGSGAHQQRRPPAAGGGPVIGGRGCPPHRPRGGPGGPGDRKSTRLNSSHVSISYAVFCLQKINTT